MERHHFAQAMCILNTEGCNILENLGKADYTRCLDLIRDNILATDLAHHLRTLGDMEAMVAQVSTQYLHNIYAISTQGGVSPASSEHHHLVSCLLMTSADLSDQTKE